jgi:hypothetical protein
LVVWLSLVWPLNHLLMFFLYSFLLTDSLDNKTNQSGNTLEKVLDAVDAVTDAKSIGNVIKTR